MARPLPRLLGASLAACAVAGLVLAVLPEQLEVHTDIVGYPTFADFDISRYLQAYGLTVVVIPLVFTGGYLLLTRLFVGAPSVGGPPRPVEGVEELPEATGRRVAAVAAGRSLLVGVVLALEAAAAFGNGRVTFAAVLVMYGAVAAVAAAAIGSRSSRAFPDALGTVNLVAAGAVVAALYGVSRRTGVDVASTGAHHPFPWLPLWLAATATAGFLLLVGRAWRRSADAAARGALERRVMLLVVAPVGLFVLLASLPGSLGTFDFFEEGQVAAGSHLVRDGAFPWRDVLPTHGVLHDVAGGLLGTWVFEDSRWGIVAGQTMLLEPLAWIAVYYLCAFLFGSNWLYLLGSQALVVTGWMTLVGGPTGNMSSAHVRFLLLPLVLLLLVVLLRRATPARAASFMALLALQVIVTPEALAAGLACLGTVVLFEIYYYERGTGLRAGFRRVSYCLTAGLAIAAVWAAFLAANRALDDWVFSWTTLVSGHELTGGIPRLIPNSDWFEMAAPVAVVLLAYAIVVIRARLRRPLAFQDWAMVAMAAFSLVYYTKFLSRADVYHLDHSFYVTIPLLFYVAYRGITFGEAMLARAGDARGLGWFPRRHTLTLPLLVVLLLNAPVAVPDALRAVPSHFAAAAVREPRSKRFGFDGPGENDYAAMREVSRAVSSLLRPGEAVFDFTNSPGLFHYALDFPPATRYYHVSLAIRQRTQSDLIRGLAHGHAGVVAFTATDDGWSEPSWDGISNQVRHYDVSRYLLDNYVPVRDVHGFVLMTPRRHGVVADRTLYFRAPPCDWGSVPNFFSPQPAPDARSRTLSFGSASSDSRRRWTVRLPSDGSASGYGWLEIDTGTPLREGTFVLADRPRAPAASKRAIVFRPLDRGKHTIRVLVGSCSQWRGYGTGPLYLTSTVPQDVREIRLVR